MLRGAETIEGRPGETMPPLDFDALKQDLKVKFGDNITTKDALSSALYPKVFDDFRTFRDKYGPVDKLDTRTFLVGPEIAEKLSVSSFYLYMTISECIRGDPGGRFIDNSIRLLADSCLPIKVTP